MLLRDMVEDPRTGMMVDPDWAEMPEPKPFPEVIDGIALDRPAPNRDQIDTTAYPGPGFNLSTGEALRPLVSRYAMGQARGTAV